MQNIGQKSRPALPIMIVTRWDVLVTASWCPSTKQYSPCYSLSQLYTSSVKIKTSAAWHSTSRRSVNQRRFNARLFFLFLIRRIASWVYVLSSSAGQWSSDAHFRLITDAVQVFASWHSRSANKTPCSPPCPLPSSCRPRWILLSTTEDQTISRMKSSACASAVIRVAWTQRTFVRTDGGECYLVHQLW